MNYNKLKKKIRNLATAGKQACVIVSFLLALPCTLLAESEMNSAFKVDFSSMTETAPNKEGASFQSGSDFSKVWQAFQEHRKKDKREREELNKVKEKEPCIPKGYNWQPDLTFPNAENREVSSMLAAHERIESEFNTSLTVLKKCQQLNEFKGGELFQQFGAAYIMYAHHRWMLDQLFVNHLHLLKAYAGYKSSLAPPTEKEEADIKKLNIGLEQGFKFLWEMGYVLNKNFARFDDLVGKHLSIDLYKMWDVPNHLVAGDLDRVKFVKAFFGPFMSRNLQVPAAYQKQAQQLDTVELVSEDYWTTEYEKNGLLPRTSGYLVSRIKKGFTSLGLILANLTWGGVNTVAGVLYLGAALPYRIFYDVVGGDHCLRKPYVKIARTNAQVVFYMCLPYDSRGVSLGLIQISDSNAANEGHESGHAVQSAILGPFYLPAIYATYLFKGHTHQSNTFFEKMATEWSEENFESNRKDIGEINFERNFK